MKELGSILFLIIVFSTGAVNNTPSQLSTASSDSIKVNSAPVVQADSSSGSLVQNLHLSNSHKNLNHDCMAFRPDSTFPRMKIFTPDTKRTDSMPIYKPAPVDPGIFIPGFNCGDMEYQD